jgi:hypothetical protein
VTVMVIALDVTVAVPELKVSNEELPPALVTVAVTVAAALNSNPAGGFKIMVPAPISRFAFSVSAGPVNVVYVPVPASDVSAERLALALVTVTAASVRFALLASAKRLRPASRNVLNVFISGIGPSDLVVKIFQTLAKPVCHFRAMNCPQLHKEIPATFRQERRSNEGSSMKCCLQIPNTVVLLAIKYFRPWNRFEFGLYGIQSGPQTQWVLREKHLISP